MGIRPTNDFNALGLVPLGKLTAPQQYRLMMMALNGDSIVTPFTDMLDRQGLTREGRARKEREVRDKRVYESVLAQLEERRIEFQRQLDRLDEASHAALLENEEKLGAARVGLRKIQERAYEITLPDGTVSRVYRDGGKVRTETGVEVGRDVVRAEDLGSVHSTWSDFVHHRDRINELQEQHEGIITYRQKLQETQDKAKAGGLSAEEMEETSRQLDKAMPEAVRRHYSEPRADHAAQSGPDADRRTSETGALSVPFERAASGPALESALSEKDFEAMQPRPTASTHAKV